MNPQILEQMLAKIPSLRVSLIGDGCIDVYWHADMRLSELSREVPQHPLPIVEERFSLGAGANVLANLAALGAKNIQYIGCIGNDWRGVIFRNLLAEIGIADDFLIASDKIITPAYCKPIRHGISDVTSEDPRIDFCNRTPLPEELEEQVIASLRKAADNTDILIVCDQFQNGCITQRVLDVINELGNRIPVIVDSRDRVGAFRNAIVKPNEVEACRCLGLPPETVSEPQGAEKIARALEEKNKHPVVVTLGAQGAIRCENGECVRVPAAPVPPPIDFVGAGDSFLAGFALAYTQQSSPRDALIFATLVSAVTIAKIGTTGVATPQEMREALTRYGDCFE